MVNISRRTALRGLLAATTVCAVSCQSSNHDTPARPGGTTSGSATSPSGSATRSSSSTHQVTFTHQATPSRDTTARQDPTTSQEPTSSSRAWSSDPAAPGTVIAFPYQKELSNYLASRRGEVSIAMREHGQSRIHLFTKGATSYITASVVKMSIMETVMVQAVAKGRGLTDWELEQLSPMIRNSSNEAATALWKHVGKGPGVSRAIRSMGARHTTFDKAGRWGLTSTTPVDQVVLADHVFRANPIIPDSMRATARKLMGSVESDQQWGMTAGMSTFYVKNGWLPRDDGWHVNSIASSGENGYTAVGMSHSSAAPMEELVATLEGAARIIARHAGK